MMQSYYCVDVTCILFTVNLLKSFVFHSWLANKHTHTHTNTHVLKHDMHFFQDAFSAGVSRSIGKDPVPGPDPAARAHGCSS